MTPGWWQSEKLGGTGRDCGRVGGLLFDEAAGIDPARPTHLLPLLLTFTVRSFVASVLGSVTVKTPS